jgi:hypothetical protein
MARRTVSAIRATRYLTVAGVLLVCGSTTGLAVLAISPVVSDVIDNSPVAEAVDVDAAKPKRTDAAEGAPSGNPLWAIPLRLLAATRDRPIFSPSRRPPPPAVVGMTAVKLAPTPPAQKILVPERPQFVLVGTIVGSTQSIGIFLDEATKDAFKLRTGDDRNGWVLREVRTKAAMLEKNEQTATLVLIPPTEEKTATFMSRFDLSIRNRRAD